MSHQKYWVAGIARVSILFPSFLSQKTRKPFVSLCGFVALCEIFSGCGYAALGGEGSGMG